ncbi:unnamed protein product [Dovyalis caffra]|uniref:Thioredoxin domain-containing protein n=1 Tax=Dovyalis caffra TaxID=77055 RepID=A0AAV1SC68_9ROSI|nr:unnamed protein product [Dovyalis caffra]
MPQSLVAVKFRHQSVRFHVISEAQQIVAEITEKVESVTEDYSKLEKEIEKASPIAIINKDLQKYSTISFRYFDVMPILSLKQLDNCGAEDVSLILPLEVFSLDTERLNSETYKLLDGVEKHCSIHKENMMSSTRGQRKDRSHQGTRANVPVVQIDPSFEVLGGGIIGLVKWNFLQTMDVPVYSLHALGYVLTGCKPCTRPALPRQHEREGRYRWREEGKAKECVPHRGKIESEDAQLSEHINEVASFTNGRDPIADVFNSRNLISSSSAGIDILATLENRTEPWLDVLYVPWHDFCQAMEDLYVDLADKLVNAKVNAGKFRVDGEHKAFAKHKLQLRSFTTIPLFSTFKPIKYSSEKRDIDSLLAFVNSLQWR